MRVLVLLLACLTLGSCSRVPWVRILNNSGAPIEILSAIGTIEGFEYDVRAWRDGLRVGHHRISSPLIFGRAETLRFRLSRQGCELWYVVPERERLSYWYDAVLELRPDAHLSIVEVAERSTEIADRLKRTQVYRRVPTEGFPVAPARDSCVEQGLQLIEQEQQAGEIP